MPDPWHDALATHAHPGLIEGRSILSHWNHGNAWQPVALHQILQALPAIVPRLPHDALALELKEVKEDEGHIAAHPLAFCEYSLNALVAKGHAISRSHAMPACSSKSRL